VNAFAKIALIKHNYDSDILYFKINPVSTLNY
jgi:hypothetical protein